VKCGREEHGDKEKGSGVGIVDTFYYLEISGWKISPF
jgi:hypothetical protein